MAIALTTQPDSNGLYSGYLPLNFVATETTNNPDYLVFTIKTSAGATITGVPPYKAPKIDNEYKFDASQIIKALFDARSLPLAIAPQTTIADLTDRYKALRVDVSDPINSLTTLVSNSFYAFSFLDIRKFSINQTANYPISFKKLLYGSDVQTGSFTISTTLAVFTGKLGDKVTGKYDSVTWWTGGSANAIEVQTFLGNTPLQVFYYHNASNFNKLQYVPLNSNSFIANFSLSPLPSSPIPVTTVSKFDSFVVAINDRVVRFKANNFCKQKEFIFINRYGVPENIVFETDDFETAVTRAEIFSNNIPLTSIGNYFFFGNNKSKVNQEHNKDFEVKGQRFTIRQKEMLVDFINSPVHIIAENGSLLQVNITDGAYRIVSDSRGVDFNFRYNYAQKQLAFI